MTKRDYQTSLSDREAALVQAVADERGITFEEAAEQLASEGLAKRVQRRTGRRPASQVLRFRKGR